MAQRTIKHKIFTYHVETKGMKADGTLGNILVERQARRGEEVDIPLAHEVEAGDNLNAFYTEEELKAIASGSSPQATTADTPKAGINLAEASEDDIQLWLDGQGGSSKPSVPQVLNAVNSVSDDDRKEAARKVLDAEQAREGEPRATLVGPLEEFINSEDEED